MDKSKRIGKKRKIKIGGESYFAYIPKNLPPSPPLKMDSLYLLLDKANTALGRLDAMSTILPDCLLFRNSSPLNLQYRLAKHS